MEPIQNLPAEPLSKQNAVKVALLLITIGLILVVGVGVILPQIIFTANSVTQVPQDKMRQALSSDYLDPTAIVVKDIPSRVVWQGHPAVDFSISANPKFQQYGYDEPFMLQEKGFGTIKANSNASSTLFTAPTAGIVWNTQGDNLMSDPSKGYSVSSIMVFNKDLSFFKVMPLPKLTGACCNASVAWLGNRYILVNEFIAGVNQPGAGNYFYVGDTASSTANKTFEPVPMPGDLSDKKYMAVSIFSHPDKNMAVLSYCLTTVETYDGSYCSQYGFAIATPKRIVEMMTKNTQDNFKTGWDENNLYIQESNQQSGSITTYTFPLAGYENDQFANMLSQHIDPTANGEPVWIKTQIPITQKVDLIKFDLDFNSTSTYAQYSRAFITLSINGKPIGEVYQEQEMPGPHSKTLYFSPLPLGTSTLEIRMDPLNPLVKSEVSMKNFSLGFLQFGSQ